MLSIEKGYFRRNSKSNPWKVLGDEVRSTFFDIHIHIVFRGTFDNVAVFFVKLNAAFIFHGNGGFNALDADLSGESMDFIDQNLR